MSFKFSKKTSSREINTVKDVLKTAIGDIDSQALIGNISDFLKEVGYHCHNSTENKHPHLPVLQNASTSLSALFSCLPVLLGDNQNGASLTNPTILMHLPNIDLRNFNMHLGVLFEAIKIHMGVHNEALDNGALAKQFISLMAVMFGNHGESKVIERLAKDFARSVNDQLHILEAVSKDQSTIPTDDIINP